MAERLTTAEAAPEPIRGRRELPFLIAFLRRLVRESPLAAFGLSIIVIIVILAFFADFIAPFHYQEDHILDRLIAPGSDASEGRNFLGTQYWFGTDDLGRDLFSRIIYGARISIFVPLGAIIFGTGFATLFGVMSAYIGGKFDTLFQRWVDAWLSIPWLLLMMTVIIVLPATSPFDWMSPQIWGMIRVAIALGIGDMAWASRVIRGSTLSVKENQYVEAARAIGAPSWRIVIRHILPNIMAPLIILATLGLGFAILSEAALSFLGLGVPPPLLSWGGLMQGQATQHLVTSWWQGVFPGVAITLAVFSINMLGDGLRDLLDPRLRGGRGGFGR
ncbi:MAG: ABC transporter permease [Dehalococcoidia bacterium]